MHHELLTTEWLQRYRGADKSYFPMYFVWWWEYFVWC